MGIRSFLYTDMEVFVTETGEQIIEQWAMGIGCSHLRLRGTNRRDYISLSSSAFSKASHKETSNERVKLWREDNGFLLL